MKKQVLFILITILSLNCYSQISFEKGYYITNFDQKINCLIKYVDWKNNPTEFTYKLSEDTEQEKLTIKKVKEFGVYDLSKYCRYTVMIDRSMDNIGNMGKTRNPIFKKERIYLKVLVEGKANLYSFEDGNIERYFYNIDSSKIEQLVYRKYLKQYNKIRENNEYKQQLRNNLNCSTIARNRVEKLKYDKKDLFNYFVHYNECKDHKYVSFEPMRKGNFFNLSIRPGLNYSSFSIQNSVSDSRSINFDDEIGFRIGIEFELINPHNNKNWAILFEPTYQYFKSIKELTTENVVVDYKSIEFPIGIRRYFFVNSKSKIYVNGSFIFDFSIDSVIDYEFGTDLEIVTANNLAVGFGYKRNNSYSLELRYQTSRELLRTFPSFNSGYNILAIIFGYTMF